MAIFRMITGWIFLSVLINVACVGSVIFMLPTLLFLPFSQPFYRAANDWFAKQFFLLSSFVLENIVGVKFIISGSIPSDSNEAMILLSNHRTRTDWIFLWSLFVYRFNPSHMKIALKYPLKYVPGFGWACQLFSFLFLKRNWNEDEGNITALLSGWVKRKYPCQLMFFAEGTDLTKGSLARSHAFAEKKGLQKYNYVLHPRVTGFLHCYNQLKDSLDAVYDVTIAYPDLLAQGEKELITGKYPHEVHVHMERYAKKDLDENHLGEWVNTKWQEKEERLEKFYTTTGSFVDPFTPPQSLHPATYKSDLIICLLFWSFWLLFTWVPLLMCSWMRWLFFLGNIVFVVLNYFIDVHSLEVKAINAQFKDKSE